MSTEKLKRDKHIADINRSISQEIKPTESSIKAYRHQPFKTDLPRMDAGEYLKREGCEIETNS